MTGRITRCEIHPAIGIARVGNSSEGFVLASEVPGQRPPRGTAFKDDLGRLHRQAARFRIYGHDDAGNVVREISPEDAEIEWAVHVANKKAAWYAFTLALDIPEAETATLRNPDYLGDRSDLVIDPGPCSVAPGGSPQEIAGGSFLGRPVSLGRLRVDERGRLLVMGGRGRSEGVSLDGVKAPPPSSLNSPRWFDDISDGPVSAEVRIGGVSVPVEPAWLVVGPPNYAPGFRSPVTMYDLVYDLALREGQLDRPDQPSFATHVLPMLRAHCDLQWLNAGINVLHGWGSAEHFSAPAYLAELGDPGAAARDSRRRVFERFRHPDPDHPRHAVADPSLLPQIYGDGIESIELEAGPAKWLTVTEFQYWCLAEWAEGRFVADHDPESSVASLDDLPLARRPAALTRAALEDCLGGPFHPGCELTWPMRHALLYDRPFRIKRRAQPSPLPEPGSTLSPEEAVAAGGPLDGSEPGDLTRWMSVPWQIDTAQCGAGYDGRLNSYLPTLWPARVPNHVIASRAYEALMDSSLPGPERFKLLNMREDWMRDFSDMDGSFPRALGFLESWSKVGLVVAKASPDGPGFPPEIFVETGNELEEGSSFDPRKHRTYRERLGDQERGGDQERAGG